MTNLLKRLLRPTWRWILSHRRLPEVPSGPAFPLHPESTSTLVAGPFVGEFGWELMRWQGYIRKLSRSYSKTIVISRPSSEYLYRDFATEFIPWDPQDISSILYECVGGRPYSGPTFPGADVITPGAWPLMDRFARENLQEFVLYGTDGDPTNGFDVVLHARNMKQGPTDKPDKLTRNWPLDKWDLLMERLSGLRVAAIGRSSASYCPPGAVDLRDAPLEDQCRVLHRSRCCIGPSSGAMHLAALCGTPLVVWTDNFYNHAGGNVHRYFFGWNPFNVAVTVLVHDQWMPDVDSVVECVNSALDASTSHHRVVQLSPSTIET